MVLQVAPTEAGAAPREVRHVTSQWRDDDDELLAALDDALRAAEVAPRDFVEAGKAAHAWHNIDAELAALTYDSAAEVGRALAATRAEPALLRALTFATTELTIDIEISHDALFGQIVPGQPADVELRLATGQATATTSDEIGWFVIRPVPKHTFRLHCRTASGANVVTSWVTQ
jgi:hypothetical protein